MHTDAVIGYKTIAIIIAIHSDYAYLSNPKVRIRAGGQLFLNTKLKRVQHIMNNLALPVVYTIVCNVISSAAKSDITALYPN